MSRIIKFRAWDDIAKKMYHSETEQFDDMLGFRFSHFETDNPVYMQFTGLHDKNGNEIYESDIVKCYLAEESEDYLYIEAGELGYVIRVISIPEVYQEGLPDNCEIIGNLYENPEHEHLLEAQS